MSSAPSSDPHAAVRPRWSVRIATVAGIPLRIHATLLFLLAWLLVASGGAGVAVALALFACVTLHEFGHALVARRYGVPTRDITLYPIGGVATLEGRLEPRSEFAVALAGPAVNVALAAPPFAALLLTGGRFAGASIVEGFAVTNFAMAAFNLLPAFPMDGGRVVRSLLAQRMSVERATRIAATVGQVVAVGLFLTSLFSGHPYLAFIAIFVFMGAAGERRMEAMRSLLAGHRLSEAMQTRFQTLSHGDRLRDAAVATFGGLQAQFPVALADEPIGLVSRADLAAGDADAYVASRMRRDLKLASPDALLEEIVEAFTPNDSSAVLVVEDGHLVGMVTPEDVGRFLSREEARRRTSLL